MPAPRGRMPVGEGSCGIGGKGDQPRWGGGVATSPAPPLHPTEFRPPASPTSTPTRAGTPLHCGHASNHHRAPCLSTPTVSPMTAPLFRFRPPCPLVRVAWFACYTCYRRAADIWQANPRFEAPTMYLLAYIAPWVLASVAIGVVVGALLGPQPQQTLGARRDYGGRPRGAEDAWGTGSGRRNRLAITSRTTTRPSRRMPNRSTVSTPPGRWKRSNRPSFTTWARCWHPTRVCRRIWYALATAGGTSSGD